MSQRNTISSVLLLFRAELRIILHLRFAPPESAVSFCKVPGATNMSIPLRAWLSGVFSSFLRGNNAFLKIKKKKKSYKRRLRDVSPGATCAKRKRFSLFCLFFFLFFSLFSSSMRRFMCCFNLISLVFFLKAISCSDPCCFEIMCYIQFRWFRNPVLL